MLREKGTKQLGRRKKGEVRRGRKKFCANGGDDVFEEVIGGKDLCNAKVTS